jgi:NAD(P)H-dependent FMN reductase
LQGSSHWRPGRQGNRNRRRQQAVVQAALEEQKREFEATIQHHKLQLEESLKHQELERVDWEAAMKERAEHEKRQQLELKEHYEYEMRTLHRTMDAAVVEAQSDAASFINTEVRKLKDMEKRRDQEIDQAVHAALEQQKLGFDAIIQQQRVQLEHSFQEERLHCGRRNEAARGGEQRQRLELKEHYEYELRCLHRTMDAVVVEAQAEAAKFMRTAHRNSRTWRNNATSRLSKLCKRQWLVVKDNGGQSQRED